MKRYFKTITAVVLAALTTAACQKENFGNATPAGQEVDVTLDLLAPQIGTKSYGDGATAKTVYVHVYQQDANGGLTYIQPAKEGASLKTPSQSLTLNGLKATYSTRLVTGQTYTFVFWAQADNAPYTYNPDAKTITVNYASAAGNDESRDAFYNVLKNVKIEGAYTASVQLTRPFAQLNFGAADYEEAKAAGLEVTAAQVKLTNASTSLNLLDGTVSGSEDVTFAAAALPTETLSAAGATYKYVAMDYVLVGKSAKTLSDVTLTLTATGTQSATPEFTYSNVPLHANYRTNIVGNLFTSPAEVNITVDPAFDTPAHNVYPELLAVAANGGSITLNEDVELSEPLVIAAGKDAVINLNGKTINFKGGKDDAHCSAFRVKGSLTIEGPGTINGGDDVHTERNIVWANGAGAKVTIKGGTFKMGKNTNGTKSWYDCIYANDGAKVEIYGGTFQNDCEGRPQSLNIQNSGNKASILVYGGTFVNYDPSTGDDYLGGNFCAEGFAPTRTIKSIMFSDVSDVKEYTVKKVTEVSDASSLIKAAENGENYIRLMSNIEVDRTVIIDDNWSYVTLDLNGHKITNSKSIWNADKGDWSILSLRSVSGYLIVKGNGIIEAKEESADSKDAYAIDVQYKSATVLLVDGEFVGRTHSVYSYAGKVYIEGGKYSNTNENHDSVINCHDGNYKDKAANIIVKGGEFANFNPGDCRAEGEHTSFLASGYKSVPDGDWYKVVVAE